ncbi:MAG: sigma factor-like helix-turn-helix DNA-binding protein [Acidithiobacillus sp.]|jgi:hypothetical protein|uniref:sigma factor-like helix-turn-helix DNA-binding protein n=1 Tax=Acidithiobacillus sp. TaxID=1872118 RepID=UPI003560E35B
MSNFTIPIYPSLERKMSNCYSISAFIEENFSNYEIDQNIVKEIKYIINNLIPDIEHEIIDLLFTKNRTQEDTGKIIGMSQEMINYYKKRALQRIFHYYQVRQIDKEKLKIYLDSIVSKKQCEAMLLYLEFHSTFEIKKQLKITCSAVNHRLRCGFEILEKDVSYNTTPEKLLYYEVFRRLMRYNSLYRSHTKIEISQFVKNY